MTAKERGLISATSFAPGNLNMTICGNRTGKLGILFEGQNFKAELHSVCRDFVFVKKSALCSTHFDEICFDVVGIPVYDETGNLLQPKSMPWTSLIHKSLDIAKT